MDIDRFVDIAKKEVVKYVADSAVEYDDISVILSSDKGDIKRVVLFPLGDDLFYFDFWFNVYVKEFYFDVYKKEDTKYLNFDDYVSELLTDKVGYRVRTKEDYDDLMDRLERLGCYWQTGSYPTTVTRWETFKEDTVIYIDNGVISYCNGSAVFDGYSVVDYKR